MFAVMNFRYRLLFALIPLLLIFSFGCGDEEEKAPPKLLHKNAVEYYVTTTKSNGLIIVTTKKDIYSNFTLLKSVTTVDTLPNIGNETFKEEDDNGNEKSVTEPLAYDIYFRSEVK